MRSLRSRFTILTVIVAFVSVSVVTGMSVIFIRNNEQQKSDQLLLLLCETGEKNLDYYFNSVQKSVGKVASFVEADIDGTDAKSLEQHTQHVRKYFDVMASKTNGVLTYYYRLDPEVSDTVKGFWYTNLDGEGFVEHKVTDITKYDTKDTSQLVWFTVPKYKGESIWLPPYITDNLNKRVISYNVPIYCEGKFIGVVGIEIDYTIMAEQVDSIKLYNNGYAFLSDENGEIYYHPYIDVTTTAKEDQPEIPFGLVSDSTFIKYTYNGVKKTGAWLSLSNGMRLVVCAPVSETDGDWQKLILNTLIVSVEVMIFASLAAYFFSKRIAKPLNQLTLAAQKVEKGNYDFELEYDKKDEVGVLTKTFKTLANNVKEHINTLNSRVFVDALTNVKNRAAFLETCNSMQKEIDSNKGDLKFAIAIFDCNNLKTINDQYGHDKGDIYLKTTGRVISNAFRQCQVFRIGGDEFAVILTGDNYQNREILINNFESIKERINATNDNPWEQVNLAMGIAEYDKDDDSSVDDVTRRADRYMYKNKFNDKAER
ncbi:MAG: diguanylate cyclase [Eubacterium sp.]|nr:diguanylate cyclase [Eubacterium sp.]MBR0412681.1 diguanylate cyclase [Eubacterium sp.]